MDITAQLSQDLGLRSRQVESVLGLLADGATVPFIARYRKERTGSLDETAIREVARKSAYYRELDERRGTVLHSIEAQGTLTSQLRRQLESVLTKTELEDLYLPYKPKRSTRASRARDAGLEPLARWLHTCTDARCDLRGEAGEFVDGARGIDTPEQALAGASDILAEELAEDAEVRLRLRELAWHEGAVVSRATKEFAEQKTKFSMYYEFREPVRRLPSHRILAMLRGENEKVLKLKLEVPAERASRGMEAMFVRRRNPATVEFLRDVVNDSLKRLLLPATETEIRRQLRERAEEEAFKVFAENLEALLLAPPAGRRRVLALDPGFRTGCKTVVLDETGGLLAHTTVFPHSPRQRTAEARAGILALLEGHRVELVAVGNGTAGRETQAFVESVVADIPDKARPKVVLVSETGASVYSASEGGAREFPDLDVTVRGAISIGRRLQDPLSELVKIDPRSIGVGQYQHDVNQAQLSAALDAVVESCVNRVGVDVNVASEPLLQHVSGLNATLAANIVAHRGERGSFRDRKELLAVPRLGAKAFEQAAGFLRIPEGENPLDNSAVHPERYGVVTRIARELRTTVADLVGNDRLVASIRPEPFVVDDVGLPTLNDILSELRKPGRDPRDSFQVASYADGVTDVEDLREGMPLQGTVTNVTNFGAFVDVGVHQDGLVHISEMADRFVRDPRELVRVGQVVTVTVLSVDTDLRRIALRLESGRGRVG